ADRSGGQAMMRALPRRRLLRGMLGGAAVSLALPFLDCFLDDTGAALAAPEGGKGGAPLPVRFGTWFWGCGVTPQRWVPTKVGADFDILPEMQPLAPFKSQLNVLSGFDVRLDGRANFAHRSGVVGCRT